MAKRLVLRGDDAGSFLAANRAIAEAFDRGLVRNASVMVPAPHFADAAELFRARPALCLGLHVTLNAEWESPRWGPVLPPERVPSLVGEDGRFLPTPMHTFQRGVDLDEAVREVKAQLSMARQHGLAIRYLDEHMAVGWVHPLGNDGVRFRALLRGLAKDEGLVWHGAIADLPSAESLALAPSPGRSGADALAVAREALLARIDRAPHGTYVLYLHPAHDGDEMRAVSFPGGPAGAVAGERAADFALATDPELARALSARSISCIRYDEI
jgi:hypothetical protein